MNPPSDRTRDVPTHIKNPELVARRRLQLVDASVRLFIKQGYHKTTTRQIARAAGFSIGSLYEYVASKEDILYLVCDAIHTEIEMSITRALTGAGEGKQTLIEMIRAYFMVCHKKSDHIQLIYAEMHSLTQEWKKRVLENEVRITGIFVEALAQLMSNGDLPKLTENSVELLAHNISVLGHMWTFRRWFLARHYSIDDYIKLQTEFILGLATG